MQILVIDNYDSFTYNLVASLEQEANKLEPSKITVTLNNKLDLTELEVYDKILISPGPGIPNEAGQLMQAIETIINLKTPLFGVCLGHQAIAEFFGSKIYNHTQTYHGVSSEIKFINQDKVRFDIYKDIKSPFFAGRYHSWSVETETLNKDFLITSVDENNIIMSLEHKFYPVVSVQYHPESYLCPQGCRLIKNWLAS